MKVLVIGATGQIGSALLHALAESSFGVTALVRGEPPARLPGGVKFLVSNPFTQMAFEEALEGVDQVIYGVGLPEQFLFDPSTFERVNYGLLRQFLSALARASCRHLTYISTYEVFEERAGEVRESHPVVEDTQGMTPYFAAMTRAYRAVQSFSETHDIRVATIHPAAVYGGRNTGQGVTDYIENLLKGRVWRAPFIVEGRFPVVHAASLARAIVEALGHSGPFLVSDQMTGLREIAVMLRRLAHSYVPPTAPAWVAKLGATLLEQLAYLTGKPPIMSVAQIRFLTESSTPVPEKAAAELDWSPMPLEEGLRRYVEEPRAHLS